MEERVLQEKRYDVAVVGGGIAGYSAALTLKSLRRDVLWLGGKDFGRKVLAAEYVRNYPAFTGSGEEFALRLAAQAEREGIVRQAERADGIYATGEEFLLTCGRNSYFARAVVLATGVESAGALRGEENFLGKGVSYCAVCDGALYRGKEIAVLLTSEELAEEAEYLAGLAGTVYLFCAYRNPRFRAENIRLMEGFPVAVEGGTRVERLRLKDGVLPVDGVFCLRASLPPSALVGGLETEGAHVKVDRRLKTNLAGVFAAGDLTGRPYQYIKAAGEGCVAAYSAHEYLNGIK